MHKELNKPISDIDANFLRALGADDDTAVGFERGKSDDSSVDKDSAEYGESQMKKASVVQQFREDILLVNLDYALQLLIEVLLERSKYVEKSLEQIFVEGDENGDGVLNFKEFTTIVSKVAPHFHERRVLKMYREALMQGDDNETITQYAFVTVCKKHGLVQLVDMVTMKKTFLKALTSKDVTEADEEAAKVLALTAGSSVDYSFALPSEEHAQDSPVSTKGALRRASSFGNLDALSPQSSVASLSPAKPGGRKLSSFVKSTILAQNFFDSIKIKHQQQEILKQQQLQMQLLQQQMTQKPVNVMPEEVEEESEEEEDTETQAVPVTAPAVTVEVEEERVPDTVQYRVGLAKNAALSSSIKDKIQSSLQQRKTERGRGHNEVIDSDD
jgi:Ca2+-binding EF-hand superfamily protein